MILLADLLAVSLVAQVLLFGGREIVTAGLIQLCLAGGLAGWAALAAVVRRKPPTRDLQNWVTRLIRMPRVAEILLIAGYIFGANSWLNVLAGRTDLRLSTLVSVLTGALCTTLFFGLAYYQDLTTGLLNEEMGRKRVKATVAWTVLMAGFALPLLCGVAIAEGRRSGPALTPELAAPEISLAWLCFCSFFLGVVLFRPWAMKISLRIALTVLVAIAAVLATSAVVEQIWRRDWYLYTLTSVIFAGTAMGVWRLVDSLQGSNPRNATAVTYRRQDGGGLAQPLSH